MTVEVNSLTPAQAEQVSRDITETLVRGGVSWSDQDQLKAKLVDARRVAMGKAEATDIRADVARRIKEAKEQGNTVLAKNLAEAMARADVNAADAEQRRAEAVEKSEKHWADEAAREEADKERRTEELIGIRTQQLLHANGWVMTEEECRQQAIAEIRGEAPDDRSAA